MSADFTAVISNGMATIRASASAAASGIDKATGSLMKMGSVGEKEMKRIGEAVTKMGGPMGEMAGKLFGAAGMSGGMAKLGVVAAGLGIAFKTLGVYLDNARAKAEAFANAAAGLRGAMRSAQEAGKSFAAGSVGTGRAQAKAENIYGKDAGGRASMLARSFGIETSDVLGAMGGSAGIPAAQRAAALEAAAAAGGSGDMSATEAMDMLSDRATRSVVLGQKAGGGMSAAQRGAAQLIMRRRGAHGPDALREATNAVGAGGPARDRLSGVNQAGNIVTSAQQDAFSSGKTELALRDAATRQANPEAAALTDWYNALIESQKKNQDIIDRTPKLIQWFDRNYNTNSAEQKNRREAVAAGEAVKGMQGDN
jgi:hypothetical protein